MENKKKYTPRKRKAGKKPPHRDNVRPRPYTITREGEHDAPELTPEQIRNKDTVDKLTKDNKFENVESGPATKNADAVRFIPLGGLEEVGRNCSYFEYKDEIVIVDIGIQFPEENTPGINYIIPNVASLTPKKKNIRGIILTHGHYDHITALHYVIEQLGNPIIYASRFTAELVKKRHEEFKNGPKLNIQVIKPGDKVRLSDSFEAEFFEIEHTIPEAYGFRMTTPVGDMVSFGDYRLDIDTKGEPYNLGIFEEIAAKPIHTFFSDSTNVLNSGHATSEDLVAENLEKLIRNAKGRVLITSFASLVERLVQIIQMSQKLGKKVAINGRGMLTNMEVARKLGVLKGAADTLIDVREVKKYKDHEIVILTTGGQGEENAGLMRITEGSHRDIQMKKTDTIVFSSSVVPGNERSVQTLQDKIARQVDEVYNYKMLDIHASGHGSREDIKLVMDMIKPRFTVPIHGYYYMRKAYKGIAEEIGLGADSVKMLDNGQVALLTEDDCKVTQEMVPASYVFVDGIGVGDVEEFVLRDRTRLAEDGIVFVLMVVDRRTGRLRRAADIITRGFINVKENNDIVREIKSKVKSITDNIEKEGIQDSDDLKRKVGRAVNQLIWKKKKRRPMITPIVTEL